MLETWNYSSVIQVWECPSTIIVDIEDRSLRVGQALSFVKGQGPTLGPPKSAAAHRTVAIPSGVAEMLAAHIDDHVADEPDALVFTSVKDSPLINRYFGHASSDASLRYLKASARRDSEIADAMEQRMNGDLCG